jgi:hypothetical protein
MQGTLNPNALSLSCSPRPEQLCRATCYKLLHPPSCEYLQRIAVHQLQKGNHETRCHANNLAVRFTCTTAAALTPDLHNSAISKAIAGRTGTTIGFTHPRPDTRFCRRVPASAT